VRLSKVVDLEVNLGRFVASIGAPSYSFSPKNAAPQSSTSLSMQRTYMQVKINVSFTPSDATLSFDHKEMGNFATSITENKQ